MNSVEKQKKNKIIDIDVTKDKKELRVTFLFALFLGIVLILVSIIFNNILFDYSNTDNQSSKALFFINIVIELIKNSGIALVIAYIFTYVSSTQAFIKYIRDRLINIIITKDFLSRVSKEERRDMAKKLLNHTEEPVYPGINNYFNKHVLQSLSLFETHFRSSYQVNAMAKIDENKSVVRVDAELRYRMYKVSGNFEELNIGFEDENVEDQPIEILTPDGEKIELKTEIINRNELKAKGKTTIFNNDASLIKESIVEISPQDKQKIEKFNYVDVVNRFTEYGNDHWHLYALRILKPCDKLSIYLSCDKGLKIKKFIPFGQPNSFYSNCRDEDRIIDIFCNEWIEAGLGVAILIAKEDVSTT